VFSRFEEARQEAKAADERLQKARRTSSWDGVGWLTGVPCTIKECFAVAGCPQSGGHPYRNHVSNIDAPAVQRLRDAGAIVLGVTNLSELCMWMETRNTRYGTTVNPYDQRHTVGGSSGGEGCAVAAMFVSFGLGSDIGGSIRMPAYFNGVFGHKPSTRLIPNAQQYPNSPFRSEVLNTSGPLCRYSEDLFPLVETLASGGFGSIRTSGLDTCPLPRNPSTVTVKSLKVYCVEDLRIPGPPPLNGTTKSYGSE